MKVQRQIHQKAYQPGDGFIGRYQKLVKTEMIPYQYRVMRDEVEGVAKSHALQNFANAAAFNRGEDAGDGFYGMVFQDSDVAKWLEAAAFSFSLFPDPELEAVADAVIDGIEGAQEEDGYLNTYYTLIGREKKWTNLLEGHELYCSGHMMEAACAYYETTGKDKLLRIMEKNALHIYKRFVEEGKEGYPGHPEIELALMKMYRMTGNEKMKELAEHFLNVRGQGENFFRKESAGRGWSIWGNERPSEYNQSHLPIREQKDAVGHAVRAVYLYTAMADLAAETEEESLWQACKNLWDSITKRRMYVTGGIGSTGIGEAFTVDYDLPNDTVYAETCASIGLMFFASRMLEKEVKGEYADVMERAFYNTVLAGVQLDGKRFFYVNPLEVVPGISGVAATHLHDLPERPGWYACACCPPNVARILTSFGKYAYGEKEDTCYCHLYAEGTVAFVNGLKLCCETEYPYGMTVTYRIKAGEKMLAVRIPGWSKRFVLRKNGEVCEEMLQDGYCYVQVRGGDVITLQLDEEPYFVYPSSKVPHLSGTVALCRGPLVYCLEGQDNEEDVLSLRMDPEVTPKVLPGKEDFLRGALPIQAGAVREEKNEYLYTRERPETKPCQAVAVPYYTWGNRGVHEMRVWIPRK